MGDKQFVYLFSLAYLMKEQASFVFDSNKEKYLHELEDMTYPKQKLLYECLSEMKRCSLLQESNLDQETSIIKNLNSVAMILDKYLIEDEISGTSLGDIAQFTPVIGRFQKDKIQRRCKFRRKRNGNCIS